MVTKTHLQIYFSSDPSLDKSSLNGSQLAKMKKSIPAIKFIG